MARIDVSEAFDEGFLTPFLLKYPKKVLNDEGVWETRGFSVRKMLGVIDASLGQNTTPNNGKESNVLTGGLTIYCKHKLNCQTEHTAADHILYNGMEYVVNEVKDNSAYGSGFYVVNCYLLESD